KPYGIGMPAVYVLDLKVRQNTRRLYAGTHGRGAYSVSLEQIVGTESPEGEIRDAAVVYPNPTGAQLFFRTGEGQSFSGMIRMTDITGRAALTRAVDGMRLDDLVLDLAGLPAGVYVLQAIDS
ncbi:MAG: T9SS type A sorting domain-containing protein, partial [Bacteroidota bacterium]